MSIDPKELAQLIANRRSIFPKMYNEIEIEDQVIWEILEAANWAPNHKKTEPWRFKVFRKEALERLSLYSADHYQMNTSPEKYSEKKHQKKRNSILQSSCVIALCMHRDPQESLPEWEELAALSCAIQNMWLMCAAHGIGAYWSSPAAALEASEFLKLKENERCYGFFYMGNWDPIELKSPRNSTIKEKVEWMEN